MSILANHGTLACAIFRQTHVAQNLLAQALQYFYPPSRLASTAGPRSRDSEWGHRTKALGHAATILPCPPKTRTNQANQANQAQKQTSSSNLPWSSHDGAVSVGKGSSTAFAMPEDNRGAIAKEAKFQIQQVSSGKKWQPQKFCSRSKGLSEFIATKGS